MKLLIATSFSILLLIIIGCKKKTAATSEQTLSTLVLERNTRKPISGASVELLKCAKYDVQFGCMNYEMVKTFSSNSQGEIKYTLLKDMEAMQATHPDYWRNFIKNITGEILLTPIAYVNIALKKTANYSNENYINLQVTRDCNNCGSGNFFMSYNKNLGLPTDTSFTIKVESIEKNTILWELIFPTPSIPNNVVKSGSSQPFILNKSDTLFFSILY